ncbi:gluconokinase [Limnohabitans sp. TS-CS-82]|uniref:gluconokinase n=1 Tax=Limnohabitans sp. TS-CS-82 TaxID=2094193 RepID=UPI000CF251BD|nr:gluconokinase [Limnohabitans sp. TS-CS-82]PQA83605.1 gluconokinase [Limnohabitans sp. TS-CS-82]
MTPPRLIIMGVSGCGKSTVGQRLAQRIGVPFLEGDALHPPRNVALMAAGTPLTDADRAGWLDAIAERLSGLGPREGLVVSCSALKRAYRDRLRAAAPDLQFVHLHGTRALLAARLRERQGHYMPPALLDSQLETLEIPSADEAVLTLDIAEPADPLVAQIEHHLQLNLA